MSPAVKAATWIVVVTIAALAGIGTQLGSRSTAGGVSLTSEELSLLIEKQFRPADRARLASDPAARKSLLEQEVKPLLAMAAEGQRLGLEKEEKTRVFFEVFEAQVLGQAYAQKHQAEFGPQGPQVPPEELERWKSQHAADLERYIRTARELNPASAPDENELVEMFALAERARQEGLQNDPLTQVQIKLMRYNTLAQAVEERVRTESEVSDAEATDYYNQRAPRGELDQLKVAHILVATQATMPGGPSRTEEEARARAQEVLGRVRAGEDFGQLAREFSDDPGSKNNGGEYTAQQFQGFVKEFKDAAYKLQPGQVSDLVKTNFGFHIIKVIERSAPLPLTPQLTQQLKQQIENERQQERVERIMSAGGYDMPDDFAVAQPPAQEQQPMFTPEMLEQMQEGIEVEPGDPHGAPPAQQKAPAKGDRK